MNELDEIMMRIRNLRRIRLEWEKASRERDRDKMHELQKELREIMKRNENRQCKNKNPNRS